MELSGTLEAVGSRPFVLASASPARLRLLTDAGLRPEVHVSGVDEAAISADDPREHVRRLAIAKARAVAALRPGALVLGCDSMLLFEGSVYGRADSPEQVRERWRAWRGQAGILLTGHCLIDTDTGEEADEVGDTIVRFGLPTDAEIEGYTRTREALSVAGPFTIDGRAAAFVDGIDGDAGNVIGLSMPLLRRLLRRLDVELIDLWC